MTRHDRPQKGRPAGVGTQPNDTPPLRQNEGARGAYLRVDGDAATFAAELLERFGPAFAESVAHEMVALTSWSMGVDR